MNSVRGMGQKNPTDKSAEDLPETDEIAEELLDIPTHIKIEYASRSCENKFLFIIYKIFRVSFVSFWFYFTPFFAMFLSYLLPWYLNTYHPEGRSGVSGE